jgi:hypothetical protein
MMKKLEVGMTVFVLKVGNAARQSLQRGDPIGERIVEGTVSKVGRKYFSISGITYEDVQFHIDGLRQKSQYLPSYKVYFSRQEIYDEDEATELRTRLKRSLDLFNGELNKLSLDQLRRMVAILDEAPDEQ